MSDRPTPETDAELNLYFRHGEAQQISIPWIEFARKLERERDEAKAEWYSLQDAFEDSCDKIEKLEQERDEAREALQEIANASHFDNIGNWARNKAKKVLEETK